MQKKYTLSEEIRNMRKRMGLTEEIDLDAETRGQMQHDKSQWDKEGGGDDFDENSMPIKLSMAILSHCSDLQHTNPQISGELNFIKAMVMKLAKGTQEMTQGELDQLYSRWVKPKEMNEEMSPEDKEAWKKGMDKDFDEYEKEHGISDESSTDCRSEIGITVGLVDSIISISRILKPRLKDDEAIMGAIADLRDDEDLAAIVNYAPAIDKEKEDDTEEESD